jgi:hypothetical protein
LGRKRLIVGYDERWPAGIGYDVRHRESLAGAGDAEQRLKPFALFQAICQFSDGLRLVSLGLEVADELKARFGILDFGFGICLGFGIWNLEFPPALYYL